MSQIKSKRTGLQPVYHESNVVKRQGGFGTSINFNNAETRMVNGVNNTSSVEDS